MFFNINCSFVGHVCFNYMMISDYYYIEFMFIQNMNIFCDTLTLKVPVTTAADVIHKYFFIVFQRRQDLMFQVNPLLDQRIHMKNQALFSLKDKSKKRT